jgi:hypothetical protein
LRQKTLCNPIDIYEYIISDQKLVPNNTVYNNFTMNLTNNELANYNRAKDICMLPKSKIIDDIDLIFRQLNIDVFSAYINKLITYFTSSEFQDILSFVTELTNDTNFTNIDFSVLTKIPSLNEFNNLIQTILKLLELSIEYDEQIIILRQVYKELDPALSSIKEWKDIGTILDFVILANKQAKNFNSLFTVEKFFGDGLHKVFSTFLGSNGYIVGVDFQKKEIDLIKTVMFLSELKLGDAHRAICNDPKLSGLFKTNFTIFAQQLMEDKLTTFCYKDIGPSFIYSKQVDEMLISSLKYLKIADIIYSNITDATVNEFSDLLTKLSLININNVISLNPQDLSKYFDAFNVGLEFLEKSLQDLSKVDIQNAYELIKKLLKIFFPTFVSDQAWFYIDLLLPIFLPIVETNFDASQLKPTTIATTLAPINSSLNELSKDYLSFWRNKRILTDFADFERWNYERNYNNKRVKRSDNYKNPEKNLETIILNQLASASKNKEKTPYGYNSIDIASLIALSNLYNGISTNQKNKTTLKSTTATTTSTTTTKQILDFGLNNLQLQPSTDSDLNIGNSLSMLNLLLGNSNSKNSSLSSSSPTSSSSSLLSYLPLLSMLPLDKMFPDLDTNTVSGLITSLPQIVSMFNSFNDFSLPKLGVCFHFFNL